jgi:hypothetical protein
VIETSLTDRRLTLRSFPYLQIQPFWKIVVGHAPIPARSIRILQPNRGYRI